MSRNVPTDRPLSDEDRKYLQNWNQVDRIAAIDASFPPGSDDDDDDSVSVDEDISNYAESLKVAELKDALKKFDIPFDSDAHKDELVATLAIGLQEKRVAGVELDLSDSD